MTFRKCSECGEPLTGKGVAAKTCGTKCRSKRSRRLKRQHKEAAEATAMPEHQKEITERVRHEQADVAHKVIEEEIRPVVRESITQDTLKAISDMVGLTPRAVAAIADDLASEDAVIRQRAYTLIMKYTVGHQAIVRPPEEDKSQPLTVHFELPRPAAPESEPDLDPVEDEAQDLKECDLCHINKPLPDFVSGSDRCKECFDAQQAKAVDILAETASD